jgi:succinate dehydrogenase/fumarate reductase flavoprotein subunit
MFTEIMEGRGVNGGVYMDCRKIDSGVLRKKYTELLRLLGRVGIDPLTDLIPISPAVHFFMGGVVIDSNGETNIPGLLACGESVGGLHGANRLGGNALTETCVFGTIAGRRAADFVNRRSKPDLPVFDPMPFRDGRDSTTELKRMLRKTTWKYLSIVRSRRFCMSATDEIERLSKSLESTRIRSARDLVSHYELKNMLATVRLIVHGARVRRESRGAHFRSDHPDTDDLRYRGSFFYRNQNGEPELDFRPLAGKKAKS